MDDGLLRRAADLSARCENSNKVTSTGFLTPAEAHLLESAAPRSGWDGLYLFGGNGESERKIAFFLPHYLTHEDFAAGDYITAIRAEAKFASPSHRDYMGALLALGIERDCLGDIYVDGETAFFYCLPSVARHILLNLDRVGRNGVKVEEVTLGDIPTPKREVSEVTFTVKSLRLDAVASGMFNISRTSVLPLIEGGAVSLNHTPCFKPDSPISHGDIISIRGYGKGRVSAGGRSKKDRIFITGEIYK